MKKYANRFLAVVAGVVTALVCAISAFAEDTTSVYDTVTNSVGTKMGELFQSALGLITTALPYILGLVGAGILIAFAVKWIKKIRG